MISDYGTCGDDSDDILKVEALSSFNPLNNRKKNNRLEENHYFRENRIKKRRALAASIMSGSDPVILTQ
jgi:hypothetical protein